MTIRVQVQLSHSSGIAEDHFINTFHFAGAATDVNADNIFDALEVFYNENPGAYNRLAYYLSHEISRADDACLMKAYDLSEPEPRTPFHTRTWTLAASGGADSMPSEVALCLSYRAALVSGTNAARRRGRIFTGPFTIAASDGEIDVSRPHANMQNLLVTTAERLADDMETLSTDWCVYSQVDDELHIIKHVWVDNAWDTQRRRGARATNKVSMNVPAA